MGYTIVNPDGTEQEYSTWEELSAAHPVSKEDAYRNGYRDGFIAATESMTNLTWLHGWKNIYDHLFDHWQDGLRKWVNDDKTYLPPVVPSVKCAYCGGQATTIDHVIPRAKRGSDDPSNLVPACRKCNTQKNARTPEEWTHRWYEKQ